jgi:excisionase family DNA binding protein
MKDKLTPAQIAVEMGVTSVTVRNWIKSGRLQGFRIGGRVYVMRSEMERFLNAPAYPDERQRPAAASR